MSESPAITLQSPALSKWAILSAWLLALFLAGYLSLVAVESIRCRSEPVYLTTEDGNYLTVEDGKTRLVAEQERRYCRLAFGQVEISVPWFAAE
jgi:hypothetical protein